MGWGEELSIAVDSYLCRIKHQGFRLALLLPQVNLRNVERNVFTSVLPQCWVKIVQTTLSQYRGTGKQFYTAQ